MLRMRKYKCRGCKTVITTVRRPTGWTVKKVKGKRRCWCPLCLPVSTSEKAEGKFRCKCHKGQPYNYNAGSSIYYAKFHPIRRKKRRSSQGE